MESKTKNWHELPVQEVLEKLNVEQSSGLQNEEAEARQLSFGLNELIERGLKSPWAILWEQLTAVMVVVLIIAAVISAILGDWLDAWVILAIVVLNAILGFIQEYRAERAMAALKKMAAPMVKVRRGGELQRVESRELVPGDVVVLEAGDAVPADGLLIESVNLRVQEASLTGESLPVDKSTSPIPGQNIPLGDRHNMVFMGTSVAYGRGTAVITGTGMDTELGRIADLIQTVVSEKTPLQKRMEQLGKYLAVAAVIIVALVFSLGVLRGEELKELFLTSVAMAVAAVPEGLAAVVTISLALGAQRMLRRKALIRKLPAVETLGSVTTICSDKTGTLTENRMTVTILDVFGETAAIDALLEGGVPVVDAEISPDAQPSTRSLGLLLKAAALCNDAVLYENPAGGTRALGDPTEGALVVAAAQMGLWKANLDQRWPRVAEIPFTSERKRMTTVHRMALADRSQTEAPWMDSPYVAFSKGAAAELLAVCSHIWAGDSSVPVTDELRQRVQAADDSMAQNGQRVLGVAFRPLSEVAASPDEAQLEQELTFIGLIGMLDPPRPEVRQAVDTCRTAGIRPVMITGDHPLTARRIAEDLKIATDNSRVLTGQELTTLSKAELEEVVEHVSVYARVSPEHKLNIVGALQSRGHIVAMTGDGVNDAPALRKSDIGVAMGITGTDVSKEAADMVITDDNFATIISAVEEGRTIYDNVRKFIKYTMTSNAGEIWVMLLAPFFGMPLPLTALQILWVNLVTDGLPGLALGVEPAEKNTMQRPPYAPNESVFSRGMGRHIAWVGLLMGLVPLGVGLWAWSASLASWQTLLFTTLTLSQMGHALAIRSGRDSLFKIGLLSNKPMLGAVLLTFFLQIAVTYWGPLQTLFDTRPLTLFEFSIALGASMLIFVVVEIEKWFSRRALPSSKVS
ncbi:MAG: cation-translocating P-type ATPase [Anaerolineales bacterium]|nr:cation-translocating P-type ATPase [Anaerolineales bacterium]